MKVRELVLEERMPTWIEAKSILDIELKNAKFNKTKCLVIVHGYGSSGVGGTLKTRTRSYFRNKLSQKAIKTLVYGERFEMYDKDSRDLILKFP